MRRWLEFHDSEFVSLVHDAEAAVLELTGYVHQWEQLATGWSGTGWTQQIRMTVLAPTVSMVGPKGLPADHEESRDVWDGTLQCGSVAHENLVPLPFAYDGELRLDLQMNSGRSLRISGTHIRVETEGEAKYVEKLRAELQPDDETAECKP